MSGKKNWQENSSAEGNDGDQAERAAVDAALTEERPQSDRPGNADDPEIVKVCPESDEDWETQCAEQKDRVLRLHAEMENLRNRTARELAAERKYGCLPLLKDILPVIDNVDRALESAQQEEPLSRQADKAKPGTDPSGLLEGFLLVRQQLLSVLEQHHCEPIDALGQPFDPQFHEAILQQPSADQPKDHVMMVTQAGYRLHDRVVRAAQVIVSAGPAE